MPKGKGTYGSKRGRPKLTKKQKTLPKSLQVATPTLLSLHLFFTMQSRVLQN